MGEPGSLIHLKWLGLRSNRGTLGVLWGFRRGYGSLLRPGALGGSRRDGIRGGAGVRQGPGSARGEARDANVSLLTTLGRGKLRPRGAMWLDLGPSESRSGLTSPLPPAQLAPSEPLGLAPSYRALLPDPAAAFQGLGGSAATRSHPLPGPAPPPALWPRPRRLAIGRPAILVAADWFPRRVLPSHFRVLASVSASPGKTRRGSPPLAGSCVGLVPAAANRQPEGRGQGDKRE